MKSYWTICQRILAIDIRYRIETKINSSRGILFKAFELHFCFTFNTTVGNILCKMYHFKINFTNFVIQYEVNMNLDEY